MPLSGEFQTSRELIQRCQTLAADDSLASLTECDTLIVDIDQANDWGFITDRQAIEMLKIVYRYRHNLMRSEKAATVSSFSESHNSIQDR